MELGEGLGEGPSGSLRAAWGDRLMLSPPGASLVSGMAVPAVALVLASSLMDTSSAVVLPRGGMCSPATTSIAVTSVPAACVVAWGWVTELSVGSPCPALPGTALWLGGSVSPVPSTASSGSWGKRAGGS